MARRLFVGAPVVGAARRGVAVAEHGVLVAAVAHLAGALAHRAALQGAEQARHIRGLALLGRVVRVQVGGAHEAAGRVVAAREAHHARAGAEGLQGIAGPGDRLRVLVAHVHVVAHVLGMPREGRLVGQHVKAVVVHVHAVGLALDDDGLLRVTHDPVQLGHGVALVGGLGHERDLLKRGAHLGHGGELRGDPQRELVDGQVHAALGRALGELGIAGEVQAAHGESRLVAAVEVARSAVHHDGSAHAGVLRLDGAEEGRRDARAAGRDHDPLAVGLAPIQIATEVHIALAVREADACAHDDLLSLGNENGSDRPDRSRPW